MKSLRESSEAEMVAAFLKAEIKSPRFGRAVVEAAQKHKVSPSVIEHPDINDSEQNGQRAEVLSDYRGWGDRTSIFERIPIHSHWELTKLDKDDVLGLRYIDYSYWNELSRGSHLVRDGVQTVVSGTEVFGVPNDQFFALAKSLDEGASLDPLILYVTAQDQPPEIIEGHVRATAIGLVQNPNITINAIVGKPEVNSK